MRCRHGKEKVFAGTVGPLRVTEALSRVAPKAVLINLGNNMGHMLENPNFLCLLKLEGSRSMRGQRLATVSHHVWGTDVSTKSPLLAVRNHGGYPAEVEEDDEETGKGGVDGSLQQTPSNRGPPVNFFDISCTSSLHVAIVGSKPQRRE